MRIGRCHRQQREVQRLLRYLPCPAFPQLLYLHARWLSLPVCVGGGL